MSPIPPSSPDSSGSQADDEQNVETRRDDEDPQEEPTENTEEAEHHGAVQNREVIDLVSDDSNFDDLPLGELRVALRQTDSDDTATCIQQADHVKNNPKDSSNMQETNENDENPSNSGAESHDEIDAEESSDDRGTNGETSTAIKTEVAFSPVNENEEDKEDPSNSLSDGSSPSPPTTLDKRVNGLYPCPPGKRPTGKKWDGRKGFFVPKSRMDKKSQESRMGKKSKEVGRRVSSKLKKNADGLYPCPIGGRRPTGMRWDGHLGAFVPRSRFRTNSIASRDSSEESDGSGEKGNETSNSKDKSSHKKRAMQPQTENDTKRSKSHHASAAPEIAPRKPREQGTEIGSRVYAHFPGNDLWYWGVIVDIKRKKMSHFDQYSVLFDDGDFVEYLSRDKYLTLLQYQEKPPVFPTTTAAKLRHFLGSKADVILSSTRGKRACGTCENCTRNACGKCARCKSDSIPCLQKMCLNIKRKWITEPAVGFPEGYCFFFKKRDTDRFPRVMIMSPGGREFTLEGALEFCSLSDPDDVSRKFNEHVGFFSDENSPQTRHPRSPLESRESRFTTSNDNFLIGRKYSFAWTDLKGQKKVVYGKVTECEIESQSEEVVSYKVEYSDKSRTLANALHNGCGSAVLESQWLEPPMAIGGCVGYDEHASTSADRLMESNLPFYTSWITPDARHEAVDNGLPQLTLAVQGYELTFKVKRSTIANAGNGVFLSCSQMFDDDQSPFELKCGELIDIGSYAPLRIGDRRSEPVMYVKCFIHSAKCEEFAFDQKGSTDQLDITDDITGTLHAIAKKSIHAYVNESNEKDDICIWAEHDAEDSIHYLLGHSHKGQGTFRLPCDGSEQEVFINYGPHYEKVRVRKGYSFLSEDEQAVILEELQDEDMKDVLEMSIFSGNEVEKATNFLFLLFTEKPASKFTDPVMVERSLLCTAILQRRAQRLFVDNAVTASSQDSLTSVRKMLRKLVFILLGMVNDERDELRKLQASGHFDLLLTKILERRYSAEQLGKLGDFLQ